MNCQCHPYEAGIIQCQKESVGLVMVKSEITGLYWLVEACDEHMKVGWTSQEVAKR